MRKLASFATSSLVLFAACGGGGGDTSPIKIALLAPETGALSSVGQSFQDVAHVAVDSINGQGGIDGRQLDLTIADTATDPATAKARFDDLVAQGVVAVVGPATSGEVTMTYPDAAADKVPIISPSSTAPSLSDPNLTPPDDGYMFRNVTDDNIQGIAIAYYLRQKSNPPVANVTILYEDTPYGRGLRDAFRTAFINQGGSVCDTCTVSYVPNIPTGDPNHVAQTAINAVAQTNPTMTVMIALEQDAVKMTLAWDNGGSPVIPGMKFFMTDGARSTGFLTGAPASIRGMCGTAPTFPITGLAYTYLKSKFEAANPGKVLEDQVYAPNVWDAFHLFGAAMLEQAKQFPDEPIGGAHLRDALTTASKDGQTLRADQWRDLTLAVQNGGDVDYDGASGPNDFNVVGQAIGPYEVWCVSADGTTFTQALFLNAQDLQALQ